MGTPKPLTVEQALKVADDSAPHMVPTMAEALRVLAAEVRRLREGTKKTHQVLSRTEDFLDQGPAREAVCAAHETIRQMLSG